MSTCDICPNHAKYTCPGCKTHTCSLVCSNTHKAKTRCSGVRNKAAYVPMNEFGYGALMDDYVYLEQVGRQIGEWGREISRGGYTNTPGERGRGRGRGGMRNTGGTRTKKDVLKMQLDIRDIDMQLLPVGMERKKLNQSYWDAKNKTALLTVQFIVNPPPNPLRPLTEPPEQAIVLTTHRNDINTPLVDILRKSVSDKSKNKPVWLAELVVPDREDEAFVHPACYMLAPSDPSRKSPAYYKLDILQKLGTVLRHKEFVEFPVFHIWEEGVFQGTVVTDDGSVTFRENDGQPSRKRRKLDVKQGKVAIKGLLGDYGSEEEEEDNEPEPSGLAKLEGYEDSDPAEWEDDDEDDGTTEDPAVLLEQLKQAGIMPAVEEDDAVDWGDSE